jgi:hypothetical protein
MDSTNSAKMSHRTRRIMIMMPGKGNHTICLALSGSWSAKPHTDVAQVYMLFPMCREKGGPAKYIRLDRHGMLQSHRFVPQLVHVQVNILI